ncbi:nucleotidyltransferase family protein [Elizabethkingia anophelis]|uniref:nucleotidyltransferase domain-containing protein n=1 Tax=Elizabethkingia anophelis TaxID=1117645 RepID=UPI00041468F1|nr:nucleotidyltransferase family protein [Elizabethkingia anophelis]MCT4137929.1 nucleotidyltransferase family protein [Elizabethkingia anophelis]
MMLEDKVAKAFFTLLRAGLWNKSIDAIDCFPMSKAEWEALFRISVQQTVEGIVFDGIQMLSSGLLPPRELHIKWLVRVEKIEQRNRWMNNILAEQVVFFSKENIQPILLKGQGFAICYENPGRRVCGDIDWYFRTTDEFYKADKLLAKYGIVTEATAGYSSFYFWRDCEIDHHQKLFDIHNPFLSGYLQNLQKKEANFSIRTSIEKEEVILPSPLLQMLQVNAHILKHLLSFGIGIRQLCDAARLYKTYYGQVDGNTLKAVYTKLKIIKWINLLHVVLVKYTGLSEEYLPFPTEINKSADWMMEEIWKSGNFGFHDERYQKESSGKREGTKRRLWSSFIKYVPYAPMEALSFPLVHFYSGLVKK